MSNELVQLAQQLNDLYGELFRVQESKHRSGNWFWLDDLERLEQFEDDLWESIQNCEDEIENLSNGAQS